MAVKHNKRVFFMMFFKKVKQKNDNYIVYKFTSSIFEIITEIA